MDRKKLPLLLTGVIVIGAILYVYVAGIREIGRHPEKIWLHRCNSMEKLHEKHGAYPNVEVDVIFSEDHGFDVTHDAENSINLDLAAYFAYMEGHEGKMWIDIKNLSPDNKVALLASLDSLTRHFRVSKERLIVESPDWESLKLLTQAGFYTSCYVTFERPDRLSDKEINSCIQQLHRIVDEKAVCALSFPGYWYTQISKRLERNIDLLTWEHHKSQLLFLLLPKGRKMMADKQLKVVLVKDKGKYHR